MEALAWTLLVLGAIVGILVVVSIGFMFFYLFAMSFDASGSNANPMALVVSIIGLIAIVAASIIPYFVYYAYIGMQAGNYTRTILWMSIILSPFFIAALYYAIRSVIEKTSPNKTEEEYVVNITEEQETEEVKKVKDAKSSVQIAKSIEKGVCMLTIENGYEYKNLDIIVYVQRLDGRNFISKMSKDNIEQTRYYTDWKKGIALLAQNEAQILDFNNLPDNEEAQIYWAEIQIEHNYLLSFVFQKIDGNIERLSGLS